MNRNYPSIMLALVALLGAVPGCDDDGTTPATEDYSAACQDGVDNDNDGAIDCDDDECANFVFCRDADGDGDGDTDGDTDGDGDTDTDTDTDVDGDGDADGDGDTDTDADTDGCGSDDECDDGVDCTHDTCDAFGTCQHAGTDMDGDGYVSTECGGDDCNDDAWEIAPEREESCDGVDQDCDGVPDDGLCCLGSDDGVRLTTADGESVAMDVVFNGINYAMVWNDTRASGTTPINQVFMGLVNEDFGRVGGDVRLTEGQCAMHAPQIAWAEEESLFGVTWTEYSDVSTHVYFQRVDTAGAPRGTPIQLTTGTNTFTALDVVWDGDTFAVLFQSLNDRNLQIAQIGPGGTIITPATVVVTGSDPLPDGALVWAGDQYAVLWIDWMGGGFGHVMLSYRTMDLSAGTEPMEVSSSTGDCRNIAAFWNGSEVLVGWADQRDMSEGDRNMEIYFNAVRDGTMLCASDVRVTDDAEASVAPTVVETASGVMMAWHDRRDSRNVILARGVSVEGCEEVSDEVQIAWGDPRTPCLGAGTGLPVVFWSDGRAAPNFEIYANTVSCRALADTE